MYYTTSGAYRKTKAFIDYANVFMTLCIVVLFVLILVWADMRYILFPGVFFAGALVNAGCGIKRMLDGQKPGAIVRFVTMFVLVILGVLSLMAIL